LNEDAARKMLVKIVPTVDFTNILLAAFMHADPKNANKYSKAISFFALFVIYVRKSCSKNVGENST